MKKVYDKMTVQGKAIQRLIDKGVTGIKVELEASLNRSDHGDGECGYCEEGSNECSECYGNYNPDCTECVGTGYITTTDENGLVTSREDCEDCEGNGIDYCESCDGGRITCSYCDGDYDGSSADGNWGSENYCFMWLMRRIEDLTGTLKYDFDDDYEATNPFSWMSYAKFYNDGSVDSELTFTVKLDHPNNAFYIPKVLQAFKDMAAEMEEELNVSGAGLHTALLWSEGATYPSRSDDYRTDQEPGSNRLPEQQLRNFKRSMTQLLPALYFLGTTNDTSRGLGYRKPHVSVDYRHDENYARSSKYSAISYRYGAMEFRVFDTCYDQPEAIMDNIVVISNSLRYLSERYISPNLDKITSLLEFGNDNGRQLDRFYGSTTHLDVLNVGLTRLKPAYYTVGQLKEQRGFKRTKATLKSLEKVNRRKAEAAYQEYLERFEWEKKAIEMEYHGTYLRDKMKYAPIDRLRTSPAEIEAEVAQTVRESAARWVRNHFQEADSFIAGTLNRLSTDLKGIYPLEFN